MLEGWVETLIGVLRSTRSSVLSLVVGDSTAILLCGGLSVLSVLDCRSRTFLNLLLALTWTLYKIN